LPGHTQTHTHTHTHTQVSRKCRKVSNWDEDKAKRKKTIKLVTVNKALLYEPP